LVKTILLAAAAAGDGTASAASMTRQSTIVKRLTDSSSTVWS
jgi:hypothetical protein